MQQTLVLAAHDNEQGVRSYHNLDVYSHVSKHLHTICAFFDHAAVAYALS